MTATEHLISLEYAKWRTKFEELVQEGALGTDTIPNTFNCEPLGLVKWYRTSGVYRFRLSEMDVRLYRGEGGIFCLYDWPIFESPDCPTFLKALERVMKAGGAAKSRWRL